MTLRTRLILVITILFLLGLLEALVRSAVSVRQEVNSEILSSRQMAAQLIELIVSEIEQDEQKQSITRLYYQLNRMESAGRFSVAVSAAEVVDENVRLLNEYAIHAPAWFVSFLKITPQNLLIKFQLASTETLLVHIDPVPKINELWLESVYGLTARAASLLTISLILYVLVGIWMKPIGNIVSALDQLVRGDFSKRIPHISLLDLNEIADKINYLASVLGASKSENDRLTRQAMTVQEQERRFLAQELHDTLGQAVSAIKAMAVSIANHTRETQPQVAESAMNIERISDDAYQSVRNLMAWLRPAVLDELGLALAIQQMVDDWNMHHEDTFCGLKLETDLDQVLERQQIQVYRIIQEALTNVAKHADATRVDIMISGQEIITITISDDGKGFDYAKVRMGIGLSNIRDRSNLLQGTFQVSSKPGNGAALHIEFPNGKLFRRGKHE